MPARKGGPSPISGSEPRADELADRLDEMGQIGAEPVKAGQPVQGALVHVERAVDLDLQAVAPLGGPALAAYDLDALVAFVDAHVVAQPAQEAGDAIGEFRAAGRAVAIAQQEIAVLALEPAAPVAAR